MLLEIEGKFMKVYAISDLHLSLSVDKPMNIFGPVWENYLEDIEKDWNKKVSAEDIVLIAGDISWAMRFDEAKNDLKYLKSFKGNKVFIKGNHDYWWNSISALRAELDNKTFALQNDAIKIGNYVICGSRGWTAKENGKFKSADDEKIYKRELIRMELSLKNGRALMNDGDNLIVMQHYPPMNNKCEKNEFTELFEKYGVNKVVYGHLHAYDKGYKMKFTKNKIQYILTSCDLVGNKLVKIY